jgi:SnoaL-like domain
MDPPSVPDRSDAVTVTSVSPTQQLRSLVDSYARTMDDRDAATLIGLFVPGGRLTITAQQTQEFASPDGLNQIIDYMRRYGKTFYFVGNHLCDIEGERATGETYSIAYHHRASSGQPAQIIETPIRYHDQYVRTSDGRRYHPAPPPSSGPRPARCVQR